MFTIEQIKAAHSNVKSGAGFPAYVQELSNLGVSCYQTYVADGHTDYESENGFETASTGRHELFPIAERSNPVQFKTDLKAHQQGKTNYVTFCRQAAAAGVEKWIVDIKKRTCTYYNKREEEILIETIPGI